MTRKKLPDGERLVVLTVRVPQDMVSLLYGKALIDNQSKSVVVRRILDEWVSREVDKIANASPDNHPGA